MKFDTVRRMTKWLVLLFMAYAMPLAADDANRINRLSGKIDYWYVTHLGQTDDEGRRLTWEANFEGDVTGKMKWWFVTPAPVPGITYSSGWISIYAARWELWVDEELLLAGETSGKTDFRDGGDGVWDGHGRVTEASGKFESLKGHEVYETGPVILGSDPPRSYSGTGIFVIY